MRKQGSMWVLAGVVIGLGLSLGRFPFLAGAAKGLAETATATEARIADWLMDTLFSTPGNTSLVVAAVLGLMAPGLTAFGLAAAASGGERVRQSAGTVLLGVGLLAFWHLPGSQAIGVVVLCAVIAGLAYTATPIILVVPCAAVATMLAATWLPRLYDDTVSGRGVGYWAGEQVDVINRVWFDGVEATTAGHVALGFAVIPFLAAGSWLLRGAFGD